MSEPMPFGGQDHKWFSVLIFIGLPFVIFYRIIKKDLPSLKEINSRIF